MDSMNINLSAVLFDERDLKNKISELGINISKQYEDKTPILICVLKGAVVFLADLMRHITVPVEVDFLAISSYGAFTESSGMVKLKKDIISDIKDRHVIIIEDIVDTGLSLHYLINHLKSYNPASIATCVLLSKPEARKIDVAIDFLGFEIENDFVVGYGLDCNERYRNLPYIGILKKEAYS